MSSSELSLIKPLTVKSRVSGIIDMFDNEEMNPDMEFIIPGLEKPLHLHSPLLIRSSDMITSMLKAKADAYGKNDPNARRINWAFEKTTSDEKYRNTLIKWLRFCYGEDQTFRIDECSAALSSLFQLQLKCQDEVKTIIESYMIGVAVKNITIGCQLLLECAIIMMNVIIKK